MSTLQDTILIRILPPPFRFFLLFLLVHVYYPPPGQTHPHIGACTPIRTWYVHLSVYLSAPLPRVPVLQDFAETLGVETPFIDTLIDWNQRMVSKEYMVGGVGGKLGGADIDEAVRPSKYA